jgi:hypothetical protein
VDEHAVLRFSPPRNPLVVSRWGRRWSIQRCGQPMRSLGPGKEGGSEHRFEVGTSGYLAGDHGFHEWLVLGFLLHRVFLGRFLFRAKRTLQRELTIGIIRAPQFLIRPSEGVMRIVILRIELDRAFQEPAR